MILGIATLPLLAGLLGGLALFLYGMDQLADALRGVAGDRMRALIARLTTNRWKGALTGALATAMLGTVVGLFGPAPALSAVPCAQALVLTRYRPGERYAQGALDGALLVGGLVASGLFWMGV